MKKYAITLLSLIILSCNAQEKVIESISCKKKVTIQYEKIENKAKKENLVADKNLKAFIIYFMNDFNHKVKGYINGELYFDDKVKTDDVSGKSEKYFGYNYSKDNNMPILKISLEDSASCFDIKIEKDYKLIYVFLTDGNDWVVRYSNTHYVEN